MPALLRTGPPVLSQATAPQWPAASLGLHYRSKPLAAPLQLHSLTPTPSPRPARPRLLPGRIGREPLPAVLNRQRYPLQSPVIYLRLPASPPTGPPARASLQHHSARRQSGTR